MAIPINLVPTDGESAEFRRLLKRHLNVTLPDDEAKRIHIKLLRLYWLMNDETRSIHPQEH